MVGEIDIANDDSTTKVSYEGNFDEEDVDQEAKEKELINAVSWVWLTFKKLFFENVSLKLVELNLKYWFYLKQYSKVIFQT